MNKMEDVFTLIRDGYDDFSKGHKKIADFIIKNYDKCAFMTASKMGEEADVSESTVVRFAYTLGYDGYPQLQKNLQEVIKNQLTIIQRAKMSFDNIDEYKIFESVLKNDTHNIKQTLARIESDTFRKIINDIVNCKGKIYIVGLRTSTSLSEYLAYYLELMMDNIKLIKYTYTDVFEQIVDVKKEDLVIGISFPRYTSRTYDILKYAKDKDANIIAITDSKHSPIGELSDNTIIAVNNMTSIVDSLVAPLSVINAIIVAVGSKKKEEVKNKFEQFEYIWKMQGIFKE